MYIFLKIFNMPLRNVIQIALLIFLIKNLPAQVKKASFKSTQLKYNRVREAYESKWKGLQTELKSVGINPENFDIYLRAFKEEQELQVWMKNKEDAKYQLVKTYTICANSGSLGPKRKEGDGQVPEGFYEIDVFNPKSDYYLSLHINYPNASDLILKEDATAGGAIMIHGGCVTIGCIPITDHYIKELYILCLEAKDRKRPVYIDIFPIKFTPENVLLLEKNHPKPKVVFWSTLRPAYDFFEEYRWLPKINVDKKGNYCFKE